jgi:rubrerythrin
MTASIIVPAEARASRRGLLKGVGQVGLSAVAITLLAGCESMAASDKKMMAAANPADDVNTLNTALALEYQAIAAYQVGAESGLLQKPVLDVAVQFQGDHKKHAEVLASTVTKLGGKPVTAKPAASYGFPTAQLKTQADVLRFAAGLEKGAASAYLGAVPVFNNRDLAKAAASILGDETMHWAVLLNALGENPVPGPFIA